MSDSASVPPARLRASHTDRERVIGALRAAVEDGRLDISEFEGRAERVYQARTLGELPEVTRDLVPAERQPIRLTHEPVAALFANAERSGRWVVQRDQHVFALFGTADLDLRDALLVRDHVTMNASSVFGRIRIRVPEGMDVRIRGRSVLAWRTTSTRRPASGDAPVLEIRGFSLFGSVSVEAPRRRRAWLPWRSRRRRALE